MLCYNLAPNLVVVACYIITIITVSGGGASVQAYPADTLSRGI